MILRKKGKASCVISHSRHFTAARSICFWQALAGDGMGWRSLKIISINITLANQGRHSSFQAEHKQGRQCAEMPIRMNQAGLNSSFGGGAGMSISTIASRHNNQEWKPSGSHARCERREKEHVKSEVKTSVPFWYVYLTGKSLYKYLEKAESSPGALKYRESIPLENYQRKRGEFAHRREEEFHFWERRL